MKPYPVENTLIYPDIAIEQVFHKKETLLRKRHENLRINLYQSVVKTNFVYFFQYCRITGLRT